MNNPIQQIHKNKINIKKMQEALENTILTFLEFIGLADEAPKFQKLYRANYAKLTGIDVETNLSAGHPSLTKYSRIEPKKKWALSLEKEKEEDNENNKS